MKSIGERVRQARQEKGWSGEQLAIAAGYKTQSGISNLENRESGQGGRSLGKIAKALNVSATWLREGPDSDKVPFLPEHWTNLHESNGPMLAREASADADAATQRLVEVTRLFKSLSPAGQHEAIKYLRFMASQHAPPILGAGGERDSIPHQRQA